MKTDDLVKALMRFGLSEPEAKAFYHLSKSGEATATQLAQEAGLSRADVYRAADGLEARGLIERTVDRPQKFLPRPIEDAVAALLDSRRADLRDLESGQETLVRFWPKDTGREEAAAQRFKVQTGRAQIEGMLHRMIERAEREIALAAPHRTVHRLLGWGVGAALEKAAEKGAQVRIITQITDELLGPDRLPKGAEVRHSELPTYAQFLIVDQKEIATYATVDPVVGSTGRPETVLWMNSPDFTMGQQTLFDDMWMQSIPLAARRAELESGRRPLHMAVVRGRLPRVDEMRSIVSRSARSVFLSVPRSAAAFLTPRVVPVLQRAASKGVQVRVLSPQRVEGLTGVPGVEQRRGLVDERIGVLVSDGAEVMLVPSDGDGDGGEERSVVSTVPDLVAWLTESLDTAWGRAKPA